MSEHELQNEELGERKREGAQAQQSGHEKIKLYMEKDKFVLGRHQ